MSCRWLSQGQIPASRHRLPIPGDEESAKWIGAIGETDGNCLWVGTGGGLWRLDKNSTELVRYGENDITKSVKAFANDENGNFYIGGEAVHDA
ncbi:hypothetical protein [uncultured Muribaculum sp.]|uniref:hypothetical protein n=2 Tax=uncultured Muribaculum sp. TaxID=1918613 RepID=UPI0025A51A7E|nr:hypothetical protein [uncultured Muribaculum sp.]